MSSLYSQKRKYLKNEKRYSTKKNTIIFFYSLKGLSNKQQYYYFYFIGTLMSNILSETIKLVQALFQLLEAIAKLLQNHAFYH